MNNIASLEDFLNHATGVGSTFPLANIQRQSTAPSIVNQHHVTPSQHNSNQNNSTDKSQEKFNDTSMNQYMASVTSDAINENPTKNRINDNLVADSNSQHELLRKELLLFCSKSLQEIKQEIKKSVSQQNQRLNNVEQKVASVNYSKQSTAHNKQCVTKKDLDALRTDLLNVFSRSVEGMKKENKIEFAEHKKQLKDLKSNEGQTTENKNQSNQLSSTEAKTLRTDLLNVFSRSVQEIKEANIIEFAEHRKQLKDLKSKQRQINYGKIQSNQFTTTDAKTLRTDLLNVFSRSVQEIKESNIVEFAEQKKKIKDLQSKIDIENKNTNATGSRNINPDVFGKSLHEVKEFNKTEFAKINKKLNEKLNSQHNVVQAIQAKLDKLNEKFNYQINEIKSLRAQLEREKKKRVTLTDRVNKNIAELNLLKSLVPSDEKPSVNLFSDNESTFSMSSHNSEQHKSIAASTISLRETKLPISQSTSEMSKDEITKDIEDTYELSNTFAKPPGIQSGEISKDIEDTNELSNTFAKPPGILSSESNKDIEDTNELSNTFAKPPGIQSGESTKDIGDTNELSNTFAKPPGIQSGESTEDLYDNNKHLDTFTTTPGIHSPAPRRLSSASGSVTSLASSESDNDQFESYLDKAQLYLQQMTISSPYVSLQEGDISSSNVSLNEGSSKQIDKEINRLALEPSVNTAKDKAICTLRLRLGMQKESGKNEKEYNSSAFLTGKRGYKVQVNAIVRLSQIDVYFLVRVYKGKYDSNVSWPFKQKFCIKLSSKMESTKQVEWFLPSLDGNWEKTIKKPVDNKQIYTEFIGPFDIKEFIDLDELFLDVNPI